MLLPELDRCYFGNSLEVLQGFPDEIVQTIVTSPPYWGLRDYGVPPTTWPAVTFRLLDDVVEIEPITCCLGLEPTWQSFIGHLVLIFREARRVLRKDGTLWLNLGDSYAGSWGAQGRQGSTGQVHKRAANSARQITAAAKKESGTGSIPKGSDLKQKDLIGIPWLAALALRADGWWLRQDIVWHKPNPMPESVTDRCTKAHEYVFLLAKHEDYFYDAVAISEPVSYGDHPRNGNPQLEDIQAPGQDRQSGLTRLRRNGNKIEGVPFVGDRKELRTDTESRHRSSIEGGQSLAKDPTGNRNKRSVWTIATEPTRFKGADVEHFATFPRALVRPCILAGTSEFGACSECGAPWRRKVEKTFHPQPDVSEEAGVRGAGDQKPLDASNGKDGYPRGIVKSETVGFFPSCGCGTGVARPCIVLDLFLGSGTVGEVSQSLGRAWLGADINPKYGQLQDIRTRQITLL